MRIQVSLAECRTICWQQVPVYSGKCGYTGCCFTLGSSRKRLESCNLGLSCSAWEPDPQLCVANVQASPGCFVGERNRVCCWESWNPGRAEGNLASKTSHWCKVPEAQSPELPQLPLGQLEPQLEVPRWATAVRATDAVLNGLAVCCALVIFCL